MARSVAEAMGRKPSWREVFAAQIARAYRGDPATSIKVLMATYLSCQTDERREEFVSSLICELVVSGARSEEPQTDKIAAMVRAGLPTRLREIQKRTG